MDPSEGLTVGEVAERAGMAASAVRYYEGVGLISATRTAGGQRRFRRDVLRRLAFIRAAGNIGLTLEEIREELGRLPGGRAPTRADWSRLSKGWRERLNERIAALEALRDGLDSCIGCGCLSLDRCAVSNPGDVAARAGAGARYLPHALRTSRPPPPNAAEAGDR